MAISGNYSDDMNEMRNASARKLEVVEERLAELTRLRDALRGLVDACPGHGPLETCPILDALPTDPAANDPAGRSDRACPPPIMPQARYTTPTAQLPTPRRTPPPPPPPHPPPPHTTPQHPARTTK